MFGILNLRTAGGEKNEDEKQNPSESTKSLEVKVSDPLRKILLGPGPKRSKAESSGSSSANPNRDFIFKAILSMKPGTKWNGDLFGVSFGISADKGPFSADFSTGLVVTGNGLNSRTSASGSVFASGVDLSLNINPNNGSYTTEASVISPGFDSWSIGGLGMKIYGSFSSAAGYLVNVKESYSNFFSQLWYNWTHPNE